MYRDALVLNFKLPQPSVTLETKRKLPAGGIVILNSHLIEDRIAVTDGEIDEMINSHVAYLFRVSFYTLAHLL